MYFMGAKWDSAYIRFLNLKINLTSNVTISVQPPNVKRESWFCRGLLFGVFLIGETWELCLGWVWTFFALELKVPLPLSFTSRDLTGCSEVSLYPWNPDLCLWHKTRTFLRLKTYQYPSNGGASLIVCFQPSSVFCKTSLTVTMPA